MSRPAKETTASCETKSKKNVAFTKLHRVVEECPKVEAEVWPVPHECCSCRQEDCGAEALGWLDDVIATSSSQRRADGDPESVKYALPKVNSTVRQAHQITAIKHAQPKPIKTTSELTPRAKAEVASKVTKEMNFGPSETVFHNLTPINVNDAILLPRNPVSFHKKYLKSKQPPAPDLCDFLDPLPPLTLDVPKPEIELQFPPFELNYFAEYCRAFDIDV